MVSASGAPMEGTSKTKLEQYLQSCASYDTSALSIKCNGLHANVGGGGGGVNSGTRKGLPPGVPGAAKVLTEDQI